jgi:hypothetical protein
MTNQQSGPVPRSTGLEIFCIAIGGLALLGAIGSALAFVLMLHSRTPMDPFTTVFILGIIIASAALGSICIALSSLLKMVARRIDQSELEQTLLQQLRATLTSASTVPMVAPVASPSSLLTHVHADDKHPDLTRGQILELLQHLRDAAMMDDAQRQQCAARHWAKRKEALVHLIERHMLSGDWCMARSRLDDLQALLPADTDVQTLGERLAAEHAARLGEDVTVARAQLRRLLNITAWQEAEEIVTSLEHKYPQDAQVQHLAADLAHEREKLERENRNLRTPRTSGNGGAPSLPPRILCSVIRRTMSPSVYNSIWPRCATMPRRMTARNRRRCSRICSSGSITRRRKMSPRR